MAVRQASVSHLLSMFEYANSGSSQPPASTKSSTHPSGHVLAVVVVEAEVVVVEEVVVEGGGDVGFVGWGFVEEGSSVVLEVGLQALCAGIAQASTWHLDSRVE